MKHRVAGRKLGRRSEHRLALLRNLSTALFERERITTTLLRAKELRPFAEKLVTLSRKETLHARRQVLRHIHDRDVVAKLFDTLAARYATRPGGYTRVIKLGPRRGDRAELALIELVGAETGPPAGETKAAAAEAKAAPKREARPRPKRAAPAPAKPAAKARPQAKKQGAKPAERSGPTKAQPARARTGKRGGGDGS